MTLHPSLESLAALVGTWSGPGRGVYPTIKDFGYREQITFRDVGKPFLFYQQLTWSDEGNPMHTEVGYLRAPTPGHVEFVLALPTGQTELAEGTLEVVEDGLLLEFSARILNSCTAKQVDATSRSYRLLGDQLHTSFDMAAVGEPLQRHLTSELTRHQT